VTSLRPAVPGVEARAGKFPGPSLIPALHAIQERLGWLPRAELEALARDTRRPLYEIQGLVSFYPHFRTAPPARVAVGACHDLPCWLAGADANIATLRDRYAGADDVEIREVSCLGRCDVAPAITVNEAPPATPSGRTQPWPNDPYGAGEVRYRCVRALLDGELSRHEVIATLTDSGLRGMGGAGFPTGRKWEVVAAQPADTKYVICNADESEPGTFKDRQILADQPHLVLEGLLVAMLVVGARQGWVFIRHEYGPEEGIIRAELDRLREEGLLGTDRRIDVFVSPGGYILGEETALLECMEGHRGEPRNKPPFPGVYGLWGKPTLINSVETLADVPVILQRGARWWRDQGVRGCTGLKFFAVSGHVTTPGVHCVAMGTTVRELLRRAGGVRDGAGVAGVQPGGASSNFLGPEQLDTPLDFATLAEAGSMLGSGALVVLAEGTDLLAAATNVLRFFRNESCGKCVPCRVGTAKAYEILSDPALDDAGLARVVELEGVLRQTSICGLGQVALGPVTSVLGHDRGGTVARPQPRG
jgi:formate dehydrogenase beta subunit